MSDKEQRLSQEHDFAPEVVDEQIEQLSSLHSAQGKQLIQDLQHGYQEYRGQSDRSLERVWQRLGQSTSVIHEEETPMVSSGTHRDSQGNTALLNVLARSSRWSRMQHSLSLLVAVVIIGVLVGSTLIVFYYARSVTANKTNHRDTTTEFPKYILPKAIYIMTEENNSEWQISRVDRATHKIVWKYRAGIAAQYTLQNDTIYATSDGEAKDGSVKYLSAIDAQTGKLRWRITTSPDLHKSFVTDPMFEQSGSVIDDYGYLQEVVESQGIVYAVSQGGYVYAFRAEGGKKVWSIKLNVHVTISTKDEFDLSVNNGIVYIAALNHLFALDARTSKTVWSTQLDAKEVFNRMQIVGKSLYIGALDTTGHNTNRLFDNSTLVFAFSTQDGHKQWQHEFKSWSASPPMVADGVVYVSTYDGNVHALEASGGSEIWKYYVGSQANMEQPMVSNGAIYVNVSGNGGMMQENTMLLAIIVLDLHGKLLWQVSSDNVRIGMSVNAVANGVVYVSKDPRQVIAYDAKTGNILWQQTYEAKRLLAIIVVPE